MTKKLQPLDKMQTVQRPREESSNAKGASK